MQHSSYISAHYDAGFERADLERSSSISDDIIVLGHSFEDHLESLKKVFEHFRAFNLKLKPRKCFFFQTEVPFLGKIVNNNGVMVAPKKIEAV